jgi:hypothetical protein
MGFERHCDLEELGLNNRECIEEDSDSAERVALGINVAMVYVVERLHAKVAIFLGCRVGDLQSMTAFEATTPQFSKYIELILSAV